MSKYSYTLSLIMLLTASVNTKAENTLEMNNDPHRSNVGFFDIHICNWPNRTKYFKVLFSSEKYDQIESMEVFTPENKLLVKLDKRKFRTLKRKNKPDKRVFIIDSDITENASTGWYDIRIKTKDGKKYNAKDYVVMNRLNRASSMQPANKNKQYKLPITLKWKEIEGAQYYQVFVRDEWTQQLIFKTKLINSNKVQIPNIKLEPGGYYSWRVHARDINEHILLGDFNMGSMSQHAYFSITEKP